MLCRHRPLVSMAAWLFCPDYRSVWIVLQRWWGWISLLAFEQLTGKLPLLSWLHRDFQKSVEVRWSQKSLQRPNRKIQEQKAGRIKDRGMSHIWSVSNVSSLYCLSHAHVAEGQWLDFPSFWLKFPIDKNASSLSQSFFFFHLFFQFHVDTVTPDIYYLDFSEWNQ